jgi:hypothetical protein
MCHKVVELVRPMYQVHKEISARTRYFVMGSTERILRPIWDLTLAVRRIQFLSAVSQFNLCFRWSFSVAVIHARRSVKKLTRAVTYLKRVVMCPFVRHWTQGKLNLCLCMAYISTIGSFSRQFLLCFVLCVLVISSVNSTSALQYRHIRLSVSLCDVEW